MGVVNDNHHWMLMVRLNIYNDILFIKSTLFNGVTKTVLWVLKILDNLLQTEVCAAGSPESNCLQTQNAWSPQSTLYYLYISSGS